MLIIVKDARVYPACKLDKLACFSFIDAARKHKILHLETMNFSREHSRQHELYVHIQLLPVAHKFRGDGAEVDTGRCWICFTTKAHFCLENSYSYKEVASKPVQLLLQRKVLSLLPWTKNKYSFSIGEDTISIFQCYLLSKPPCKYSLNQNLPQDRHGELSTNNIYPSLLPHHVFWKFFF